MVAQHLVPFATPGWKFSWISQHPDGKHLCLHAFVPMPFKPTQFIWMQHAPYSLNLWKIPVHHHWRNWKRETRDRPIFICWELVALRCLTGSPHCIYHGNRYSLLLQSVFCSIFSPLCMVQPYISSARTCLNLGAFLTHTTSYILLPGQILQN